VWRCILYNLWLRCLRSRITPPVVLPLSSHLIFFSPLLSYLHLAPLPFLIFWKRCSRSILACTWSTVYLKRCTTISISISIIAEQTLDLDSTRRDLSSPRPLLSSSPSLLSSDLPLFLNDWAPPLFHSLSREESEVWGLAGV
jgi:hypothetical protein